LPFSTDINYLLTSFGRQANKEPYARYIRCIDQMCEVVPSAKADHSTSLVQVQEKCRAYVPRLKPAIPVPQQIDLYTYLISLPIFKSFDRTVNAAGRQVVGVTRQTAGTDLTIHV
jgi:hypothetical protein